MLVLSLSACENGNVQSGREELLNKTGEKFSQEKFLWWVEIGNVEMARLFIKAGGDVNWQNKYGESLLTKTVVKGSPEMVELLISSGANVNSKDKIGLTPLHHVAYNIHAVKIATILMDKGASVNAKAGPGVTPLHVAVFEKRPELVELLIKHGADVNVKSSDEGTPLDVAIFSQTVPGKPGSRDKIIEILKRHGAKSSR